MNLHTLGSLTETDRTNLADIAWFIKGMIHAGDTTFCEDHEKSLSHVIGGIENKINDEKDKNSDKARVNS